MKVGDIVYRPHIRRSFDNVRPDVFDYVVKDTHFPENKIKVIRKELEAKPNIHGVWSAAEGFYTSEQVAFDKAIEQASVEIKRIYRIKIRALQGEIQKYKDRKVVALSEIRELSTQGSR